MRKRRKVVYIASIVSFFLTIILIVMIKQDHLLNYLIQTKLKELEAGEKVTIAYETIRLTGISTVAFNQFVVLPLERDTLMKAQTLEIKLDFWELIKYNWVVNHIEGQQICLNLVKDSIQSNYEFLFGNARKSPDSSGNEYGIYMNSVINRVFNLFPEKAKMMDLWIHLDRYGRKYKMQIPDFSIVDSRFSSQINFFENGKPMNLWQIKGNLQPSRRQIEAVLTSANGAEVELPGLRRWDADVSFESFTIGFNGSRQGGVTPLKGNVAVTGLKVNQPDLSSSVIQLDHADFHYILGVKNNTFEIQKGSTVRINELEFQPTLLAQRQINNNWHFRMEIDKPFFPATQLFSSLPKGLFETLKELEVAGELAYHFLLDVDFSNLDSLKLESELIRRNFRITSFGKGDLLKLNHPFLYTAYDKGVPVRTFEVGPAHPGFLPLDQIPPLIRAVVLQSEDGSFFQHKGFRMDALQEALIHDLTVHHFARGGSTISMQLVKNVYLNRNKNLFRKLEEALLVWLIENEGLSSKHRMYEIYLNICEWGPGIYGVREASLFYFSKEPSHLTVSEAIFLASIIPKPKRYRGQFTPEGVLQPWMTSYFHTMASWLVRGGHISEEEFASVDPSSVRLTGPAGQFFQTVPVDSLQKRNIQNFGENGTN